MKTRNGLPKHCTRQAGRVRFRTKTFSAYLTGIPWSEDFMRQYAAVLEGIKAESDDSATKPTLGSIDALIENYYRLVFPTLGAATQAMRRGVLERFRKRYGHLPVARLERPNVADIVAAKTTTPDAANNLRKILRHLMEHAIALGMIEHNPVVGTKLKTTGSGIHCWTDAEIAGYRSFWPLGTQQRLTMELALGLGLAARLGDVARIGPPHRRGDVLDLRHSKNNREAFIPLTDELRAAIEACPTKHLTYLHTKNGKPRSRKALGGDFRQWCNAAGLPKRCSIHGLRKARAWQLAEAGASAREIMSITGHKTLSEVRRYTDAVEQARLAR